MDLKEIRRARLAQLARLKRVDGDPSGLAALIGKKPNQVYNLLAGHASFGEKVARSIEDAAKLPMLWLDLDEAAGDRLPGWPFDPALLDRLVALNDRDRAFVEGKLEAEIERREYSIASTKAEVPFALLRDPGVSPTTGATAPQTSALLENARVGGKRAGSKKSGGVPMPRSGRGPKRTA